MLRSDANRLAATAAQDAYAGLSAVLDRLIEAQAFTNGHDAYAVEQAIKHARRAVTHIESMRVFETTSTDWGI